MNKKQSREMGILRGLRESTLNESDSATFEHKGYVFSYKKVEGGRRVIVTNDELNYRNYLEKEGNKWVNPDFGVEDTDLEFALISLASNTV